MASKYNVGDIVWAKMRGYPPWPAKVVPSPRTPRPSASKPYFVFFYGTHEIARMSGKDMQPYYEFQEVNKKQALRPGLGEAIEEVEGDPELAESDARYLLEQLMRPRVKGRGRPRKNHIIHSSAAVGQKHTREQTPAEKEKGEQGLSVADDDLTKPQAKRTRCTPANGSASPTGKDILALAESSTGDAVGDSSPATVVKTEPPNETPPKGVRDLSPSSTKAARAELSPCRRSARLRRTTRLYQSVQLSPASRRGRRKGAVSAPRPAMWNRSRALAEPAPANAEESSPMDLLSVASEDKGGCEGGVWEERGRQKEVERLGVPRAQPMSTLLPEPESIIRLPVSLLWPETIGLEVDKPAAAPLLARLQPRGDGRRGRKPSAPSQSRSRCVSSPLPRRGRRKPHSSEQTTPSPSKTAPTSEPHPLIAPTSSAQTTPSLITPISTTTSQHQLQNELPPVLALPSVSSQTTPSSLQTTPISTPSAQPRDRLVLAQTFPSASPQTTPTTHTQVPLQALLSNMPQTTPSTTPTIQPQDRLTPAQALPSDLLQTTPNATPTRQLQPWENFTSTLALPSALSQTPPTIRPQLPEDLAPVQTLSGASAQATPNTMPTSQSSEPSNRTLATVSNVCDSSQSSLDVPLPGRNLTDLDGATESTSPRQPSACSTTVVRQAVAACSVVNFTQSLAKSARDKSVDLSVCSRSPGKPVTSGSDSAVHLAEIPGRCSLATCNDLPATLTRSPSPLQERPTESCSSHLSSPSRAVVQATSAVPVISKTPVTQATVARATITQSSPTKPHPYQTRRLHDPSGAGKVGFVERLTARYSARQQGWARKPQERPTASDNEREGGTEIERPPRERGTEKKLNQERDPTAICLLEPESAVRNKLVAGEVTIEKLNLNDLARAMGAPLRPAAPDSIVGRAERTDVNRDVDLGKSGTRVVSRLADEVKVEERSVAALTSDSSAPEQSPAPEASSCTCSSEVERTLMPEEAGKGEGAASQMAGILLTADQPGPLVPHSLSPPSDVLGGVVEPGSTETRCDGGAVDFEGKGSEAEESVKPRSNRPPPLFPIRPSMSIVDALRLFNSNIKSSLVLQHIDTQQALKQLRDLLELNFGREDIQQVPDLVNTLRKARMFKSNSRVKSRAEEAYSKIKGLYLNGAVATQPNAAGGHKRASTGRGRGRPVTRKRPQSVISIINQRAASSVKDRLTSCGQKPVTSNESSVCTTDGKLSVGEAASCDGNTTCSSSAFPNQLPDGEEPTGLTNSEESPWRRRNQHRSTRTRINYNEMARADSDNDGTNGGSANDDQVVPQL